MENTSVLDADASVVPITSIVKNATNPKRGYQKHGFTNVMKAAQGFNPKALDGRTTLAKELSQELPTLKTNGPNIQRPNSVRPPIPP